MFCIRIYIVFKLKTHVTVDPATYKSIPVVADMRSSLESTRIQAWEKFPISL